MAKARKAKDADREERIRDEIVVDAHDEGERAMGWYCYLDDTIQFPFTARCVKDRPISPLRVDDEVDVLDMAPENECEHEMFVIIRWDKKPGLAVPLSSLKAISDTDETTQQAVEDWHYWVNQGYQF